MENIFSWLPARWLVALLVLLALAGPALAQTTPTVTTNSVNGATETSAVIGGNLTSLGTAPVTDYGVVYKLSNGFILPTINDSRESFGAATSTGSYSRRITGLASGAYYDVRAYAISNGIAYYADRVTFATVPPAPVLNDLVRFSPASVTSTRTPTYTGTSQTLSVTVYVGASAATATSIGSVAPGGTSMGPGVFSLQQPTALADGTYVAYATATNSGANSPQSARSNEITFTVDATGPTPTISSTAGTAGGTTTTRPFPFTVTFSEPVGGFSASGVTVSNGTLSAFAAVNQTTYTFTVTPTTAGTATTVSVPASVTQDFVGNRSTAAVPFSLTYTPPTPPIVTTSPASSATESMVVLGGNVTSTGGATVTDRGVRFGFQGSLTTVVSMSSASGTGSYSQNITRLMPGSTYYFQAYATNSVGTSYGDVLEFNTVPNPPVLNSPTALNSSNSINTSTPTYTGNSQNSPVTVYVGTTEANATSIGSVATANSPFGGNYNFSIVQPAAMPLADGTYVAYATSTIGGPRPATSGHSNLITFKVDTTPPTPTISSTAGTAGGTTSTRPFPFTVTFSEPVYGFVANSVTVANGTLSAFVAVSTTVYTFTVTPTTAGTATTVSVLASVTQDGAYNRNTAATPFNLTYTAPTAPTVATATPTSVVETAANLGANLTSTGGADVTDYGVVYLRYNSPALPTVNDNKVSFGTATGPRNTNQTVTGLVPGVLYTVRAYAINSVSVSPVYGDPVQFYTEPSPPTLDAVLPFASSQVTNRRQFAYTGRSLYGDVTVYVGATVATATVAGTGSTQFGNPGSSSTFSVNQSTPLADGTYVAYATTKFGQSSESGRSNVITFTVDATAPTPTISSTAGTSGSTTATTPFPITVTFSEPVYGFSASSVTVDNGTLSAFVAVSTTVYTFTVSPTTAGTVTTVNVPAGTFGDAAGNRSTAAVPFNLTYSTATTWTGAASTDWFTAGNWTAGVPTGSVDARIAAGAARYPVLTTGSASANNLTLASGASLTQSGGTLQLVGNLTNNGTYAASGGTLALSGANPQTIGGGGPTRCYNLTVGAPGAAQAGPVDVARVLTLTGNLTTNGNALTLLSGASGDALVNNAGGVVLGAATVQRYIDPSLNPGLGYRHFSAPMSTSTVGDLATSGFTPVVNPAYNSSATPGTTMPFPTVYGYDQSRLSLTNNLVPFDKGFFSPSALSDRLLVGQGYTVNLAASQLVDFTGTLITSNVTLNLASNRTTNPDGGWQLVGNPYPAPLDYSLVAPADRPNLDGAIFVYSSTSQYGGRYRSYVNGVGGNPVIPMGQGFFVRVAAGQATGLLTFRNSQRLTTPNPTTFQRTAAETRPLVQLTLKGAGSAADAVYVYFENGASEGFDSQYDAAKLPNTDGLNLSASLGSQQLAIDGRPELGNTQRVIPLAVGVPAAGTYSLSAAQLLNLATTPVYLRDVQLGTLTDLRLQPSYQFTVSNASALLTGRFELVLSPQKPLATVPAALAQQVSLYPNPAKTAASVELPASLGRQAVTATLVDALGRQVRTLLLPAQGALAHQLDLTGLATGVYALRLSTSAGIVVKKLVVE